MQYNLLSLTPSQLSWLDEHLIYDSFRDDFFRRLYRMLTHDTSDVAQLDTIYCSGIELRKAFSLLTRLQQEEIRAINNMASRSFLDGVHGLEFSLK